MVMPEARYAKGDGLIVVTPSQKLTESEEHALAKMLDEGSVFIFGKKRFRVKFEVK